MTHVCGACGAFDVKLYRIGGAFFRENQTRCAPCARFESDERNTELHITEIGLYVPLVLSPTGEPWGYSAIPAAELDAWFDLPEK